MALLRVSGAIFDDVFASGVVAVSLVFLWTSLRVVGSVLMVCTISVATFAVLGTVLDVRVVAETLLFAAALLAMTFLTVGFTAGFFVSVEVDVAVFLPLVFISEIFVVGFRSAGVELEVLETRALRGVFVMVFLAGVFLSVAGFESVAAKVIGTVLFSIVFSGLVARSAGKGLVAMIFSFS